MNNTHKYFLEVAIPQLVKAVAPEEQESFLSITAICQ